MHKGIIHLSGICGLTRMRAAAAVTPWAPPWCARMATRRPRALRPSPWGWSICIWHKPSALLAPAMRTKRQVRWRMIVEEPVPYAGIARIRFDGLADRASQPLTGTPTAEATL